MENINTREQYLEDAMHMGRAIELAKQGEGWVNPNPMVGAVIVKNGNIIGEGYHERYGELHAERNALASMNLFKGDEVTTAEGATLYVTLEPCCHEGNTPPCTDAIIENKFARVVIGSRDPNPKVAGQGVAKLKEAGIEVVEDFMREECDELNPVFFHFITTNRPYVVMKYAMTADGKIATKTGESKWITGEPARNMVQSFRNAYMGIMVGIGTVMEDDPLLNCRTEGGRNPLRIICDSKLSIPLDSQICETADKYETMVVSGRIMDELTSEEKSAYEAKLMELQNRGIGVINVPGDDGRVDLKALTEALGHVGIDSILIEGGGAINESALKAGIVNEVKTFIAPKLFGGEAKSPVMGEGVETPDEGYMLEMNKVEQIGEDIVISYKVK